MIKGLGPTEIHGLRDDGSEGAVQEAGGRRRSAVPIFEHPAGLCARRTACSPVPAGVAGEPLRGRRRYWARGYLKRRGA